MLMSAKGRGNGEAGGLTIHLPIEKIQNWIGQVKMCIQIDGGYNEGLSTCTIV